VILDYPNDDFSIKVNPNNIISVCLEAPNEGFKYRQYTNKKVASFIINWILKRTMLYLMTHYPNILIKVYDFLIKKGCLVKEDKIVWIISDRCNSKGQRIRMDFLDSIRGLPFVDLYGRGIYLLPISGKPCSTKNML